MTKTQKLIGGSTVSLLLLAITMFSMCGVKLQKLNSSADDQAFVDDAESEFADDIFDKMEMSEGDEFTDAGDSGEAFGDDPFADDLFSEDSGQQAVADADDNASDSGWDNGGWGGDDWTSDGWGDDGFATSSSETETANAMDAQGFESDDIFAEDNGSMDSSEDPFATDTAVADNSEQQADDWITPELMEKMRREVRDLETIMATQDRVADSLRQIQQMKEFQAIAQSSVEQTRELTQKDFPVDSEGSFTASGRGSDFGSFGSNATGFQLEYEQARSTLLDRQYDAAIAMFSELVVRSDAGDLADNCQYWIAEAYYAKGEYYQAAIEFEKVSAYANSNKSVDAQLMLGLALMKAGEVEQAETELSTVINFYPGKKAARKAQKYIDMIERV